MVALKLAIFRIVIGSFKLVLRDPVVSCALIGASHPQQIRSAVDALGQPPLDDDLQQKILSILA